MKNKKLLFLTGCIVLFLFGGILGIFYSTKGLQASSPEGETSAGEQPASVYYDEHWTATKSYVATRNGYLSFDPSTKKDSPVTGEIEYVSFDTAGGKVNIPHTVLEPDMVITKWKVHGHIHFAE